MLLNYRVLDKAYARKIIIIIIKHKKNQETNKKKHVTYKVCNVCYNCCSMKKTKACRLRVKVPVQSLNSCQLKIKHVEEFENQERFPMRGLIRAETLFMIFIAGKMQGRSSDQAQMKQHLLHKEKLVLASLMLGRQSEWAATKQL